jgi:cytochrome c
MLPSVFGRAVAMKYLRLFILSTASTVATATAGFGQHIFSPLQLLRAEQAAGARVFEDHCAACHTQRPGALVVFGPSLEGVVGRPAGSMAGFPYSDALKKSGLVWTEDNLRKWIADSAHTVPNTLMPHVSISDPAEQIYLVAYLKTAPAAR